MFKTKEELQQARVAAWDEYVAAAKIDTVRNNEVQEHVMHFGEVEMKYGLQVIGEPLENGYPLYIALHGGGFGETPDVNNQQWEHMYIYYRDEVKNGVYVNPRGVRDTWDTHGNPESYPLYDRLIENMILYYNVDPNRVYILGFSAGGDGVYLVSPRMADRFAAANMSAGHHNGTSVTNLYNTPIQLQVGMKDTAYDRHLVTVEYDKHLDDLHKEYHGGYEHNVFVHVDKPHNFKDWSNEEQCVVEDNMKWHDTGEYTTKLADTNAIHFLNHYTRNPLPTKVVWDLGNRGWERSVESFYWLSAPMSTKEGIIEAEYNNAENSITIMKDTTNGQFSILVNEDMLDVFRPVTIHSPKGNFTVNLELSEKTLKETTCERGDKNYQFAAKIDYSSLV